MTTLVYEVPTQENFIGSRYREEIIEPHSVPIELSHLLTFSEYRNILMSCKSEIDSRKRFRFFLAIPMIVIGIIFGILFATNVASHLFLIIGLIVCIWNNKFSDKINELNHFYASKGIRIERKIHHSKDKDRKTTSKIYIYYSSPTIPMHHLPMYPVSHQMPPLLPPQQQQQKQQQYSNIVCDILYDKQVDNIINSNNYNISIDPQPLLQQEKSTEKTPLIKN
ncbi:hypothetical protein DICPUDRAFT_78143 [Dictyostelium purpureum]|uniref:Uncharacterized protein n=1 Tax=Dictyostelium purpureum TaxID=5786 RepID=F0ZIP0_DICPU|nr:uncharacterized protein DICPUDRAFT_78143 [Dictyostelium purpureum]EGC36202.1 hypothetical protein DICPUDRAFT_78143 [Dictyostelium purpureum]|eukprot:XP_003287269.1 hypothetical protein DICPUDRAFT_78143 [Dictyostelium purpureum]